MLTIILIVLAAIVAIVLLFALIQKKEYTISSEIIINRPKEVVFDYVKHLRNQEKYSKWVMADPNSQLNYIGTDGTVGFISSWKSEVKNVGIGEQEIKRIQEGELYEVEIRFKKPFEGVSCAITKTEAVSKDKTKVTTTFYTRTEFPMSAMIPMIKKMLKKDMEENASNLKRLLENQ